MPYLAPQYSALDSIRLMSYTGGWSRHFEDDQDARNTRYAFNEAFLGNRIYREQQRGGFRETIFKDTFNMDCAPDLKMVGAYNPIPAIVQAYSNVFRGSFGQEIKVSDKVNGKPVNPALVDEANSPIARIWQWSNLNTEKQLLQRWAANLGTVGIRIVAQNDDDVRKRRVFLQMEHPSVISDFDTDNRGNVTDIELKYKVRGGKVGDERRDDVEVREVLSKDRIIHKVDGKTVRDEANELGVCPYVVLKHRDEGLPFGRWAYSGAEDTIHWVNWIATNQGESVIEHIWPTWFAAAGGPKPTEFPFGRNSIAYVRTNKDTPNPIFEPLVADLDQAGTLAYWDAIVERLHERHPELALVAMKVLSGQSGETIAKLQVPADSAVREARAQYEHAVNRAIQIGLSEGIRMSLWDLGTGMGDAEKADAAYQAGKEDFEFVERAALPPTPYDRITQAEANVAEQMKKFGLAAAGEKAGVDDLTQLMLAGYTEAEAQEIIDRKAKEDVIPEDAVGQDFGRRNGNGKPVAR